MDDAPLDHWRRSITNIFWCQHCVGSISNVRSNVKAVLDICQVVKAFGLFRFWSIQLRACVMTRWSDIVHASVSRQSFRQASGTLTAALHVWRVV